MTNISQTFKAQFFSSIGDASQIVRLFDFLPNVFWSAPLKRMRVLYEGSHKEIIDDQKAKTTKA